MNMRRWIPLGIFVLALVLMVTASVWAASAGQETAPPDPLAPLGSAFTYQGRLRSDGNPVNDDCDMVFELWDGTGPGSRRVAGPISDLVEVRDGLFTVRLDFDTGHFLGSARWLDIAVQCPDDRDPVGLGRQELTAVPYALYALDAPWDGLPYKGVVVVAKSGGDYASVQAAIDSIGDAGPENPYLVWIAPGVYEGEVTMAPYIHLQGAGKRVTKLQSDGQATIHLASATSLRDLTVANNHSPTACAMIAEGGVSGTQVADVEARAEGGASSNYGIRVFDAQSNMTLQNVEAEAMGGSGEAVGLYNEGLTGVLGGSYTATQGADSFGIKNFGDLTAEGIFAAAGLASVEAAAFEQSGGGALVMRSSLEGPDMAAERLEGYLQIEHTRLAGAVLGSPTCIAVTSGSQFYAESCPP